MESLILKQIQLSRAKLKASGRVSALLAGFAIVGIIELEVWFLIHLIIETVDRRHQR